MHFSLRMLHSILMNPHLLAPLLTRARRGRPERHGPLTRLAMADTVVAMVIRASDGARCSRFVPAPKVPAKNARSALLAEIAEVTAGSALSAPELVEREPASRPSGTAMDFLGSVPVLASTIPQAPESAAPAAASTAPRSAPAPPLPKGEL